MIFAQYFNTIQKCTKFGLLSDIASDIIDKSVKNKNAALFKIKVTLT